MDPEGAFGRTDRETDEAQRGESGRDRERRSSRSVKNLKQPFSVEIEKTTAESVGSSTVAWEMVGDDADARVKTTGNSRQGNLIV